MNLLPGTVFFPAPPGHTARCGCGLCGRLLLHVSGCSGLRALVRALLLKTCQPLAQACVCRCVSECVVPSTYPVNIACLFLFAGEDFRSLSIQVAGSCAVKSKAGDEKVSPAECSSLCLSCTLTSLRRGPYGWLTGRDVIGSMLMKHTVPCAAIP